MAGSRVRIEQDLPGEHYPGGESSQRVTVTRSGGRRARAIVVRFLQGAAPASTGIDDEVAILPYDPTDGITTLQMAMRRVDFRIDTPGATDAQITLQKSPGYGAFSATDVTSIVITPSQYQVQAMISGVKMVSGELLRLYVNLLPAAAKRWLVQVLLEEV